MYEKAQLGLFEVEPTPVVDDGWSVDVEPVAECDVTGTCESCGRTCRMEGATCPDCTPAVVTEPEFRAPWYPTHPRAFRRWLWEHLAKHQQFPRAYRPHAVDAVRTVATGGDVPAWIARTPEHVRIVRSAAAWYARQAR